MKSDKLYLKLIKNKLIKFNIKVVFSYKSSIIVFLTERV